MNQYRCLVLCFSGIICSWTDCTTHYQRCSDDFPLLRSLSSTVDYDFLGPLGSKWILIKEPNSVFFVYHAFLHLNRVQQGLPPTLNLTEVSIAFSRAPLFLHVSMHVFLAYFTYVHTFACIFLQNVLLHSKLPGERPAKGSSRLAQKLHLEPWLVHFFQKAQSSLPNWIFPFLWTPALDCRSKPLL